MSCHWLPSSCHWAVNKLVKQILIGSSLESQRRRIIPEEGEKAVELLLFDINYQRRSLVFVSRELGTE